MSALSFQSFGGVLFSQLGMTATVSRITTTVSLIDTTTGQTTIASFPPPTPNYVISSEITLVGASSNGFTNFPSSTVSLTTVANRPVDIDMYSQSNGYVEIATSEVESNQLNIRLMRGPSTVVGLANFINIFDDASAAFSTLRLPVSCLAFLDASPLAGGATYFLQFSTAGSSTSVSLNGVKMMVRQL